MTSHIQTAHAPHHGTDILDGFGAGVAVEGVPLSVSSIDVIELEPKVIDANPQAATLPANGTLRTKDVISKPSPASPDELTIDGFVEIQRDTIFQL